MAESSFSPEVKERAVRLVAETRKDHPSEWAAMSSIASKIGCTAETLRKWVRRAERDAGVRPGPTSDDRQRVKELERDNREEGQRPVTPAAITASFTVSAAPTFETRVPL